MSAGEGRQSPDPRQAAAAWHAHMESATVDERDRAQLADWLRQSPAHVSEFLKIGAIRQALADPEVFAGLSVDTLRQQSGSNVEALSMGQGMRRSSNDGEELSSRRAQLPSKRGPWALAASVLFASVLAGIVVNSNWATLRELWQSSTVYATGAGEQRSVVLPDGSIAQLNTRSRIRVQFDEGSRKVVLAEGEALFRVAKESRRPFRVYSDETVVQAVGTQFTVRRDVGRTTVTVLEGRVSVGRERLPAQHVSRGAGVEIGAGQRIAVEVGAPLDAAGIQKVELAAATAWQQRRLVFDRLSLQEVVAEFNRYNSRQIRLSECARLSRPITGVFDANDADSFIAFVQRSGEVSLAHTANGDLLLSTEAGCGPDSR